MSARACTLTHILTHTHTITKVTTCVHEELQKLWEKNCNNREMKEVITIWQLLIPSINEEEVGSITFL